jgi:hypothetical protein
MKKLDHTLEETRNMVKEYWCNLDTDEDKVEGITLR